MWVLIVSVPDHCLSFYFATNDRSDKMFLLILNHKKKIKNKIRPQRVFFETCSK